VKIVFFAVNLMILC